MLEAVYFKTIFIYFFFLLKHVWILENDHGSLCLNSNV